MRSLLSQYIQFADCVKDGSENPIYRIALERSGKETYKKIAAHSLSRRERPNKIQKEILKFFQFIMRA